MTRPAMQTPKKRQVAALAAVYRDAMLMTDQVEAALLACLDLFERLEALRPESRLSEVTIRTIMRVAAAHVMDSESGSSPPHHARPAQ